MNTSILAISISSTSSSPADHPLVIHREQLFIVVVRELKEHGPHHWQPPAVCLMKHAVPVGQQRVAQQGRLPEDAGVRVAEHLQAATSNTPPLDALVN